VAWQKKYCPAGKTIINGIQTNGILIDAQWCRFLSEERFLVGLSLDGPERLHDRFRKYADNRGTFKNVMQAFDLLVMHGIDPEVLCVVSADNAQYPLEIYRFLLELGVPFVSFIPLVERSAEDENRATIRSVSPEGFGDFLCTIFDEWVRRDIGKIKIQIFEEAIRKAFGLEHSLCIFRQNCGVIPVVEHNGNYYPCDHYVGDSFLAGNVNGLTLKELLNGERLHQFGHMKSETLPAYCKICEVKDMCNGECPKNRFICSPDGEKGLNYLCNGYRKFFTHCRPFIKAVADQYKKGSDPVGHKQ
jgi:uncharacterized protein